MRWFLLCLIIFIPWETKAAVSISEIAWMGTATSANHEWLELHNDGGATDVTGWVISDGMNLSIPLTGVIPANTYVVLERTSDASAEGTAWLIYTGSLVNTGATLRLEDSVGNLVDQVSGGDDWENIGGDNVTKETAQYSSSGWVTAPATPGSGLVWTTESDKTNNENKTKDNITSVAHTSANSGEPVVLRVPDVTLELAITAQTVGYVHQPITFAVKPTGIGSHLINSLTYEWNFGDGFTANAKDVQHIFDYPGTYVVTVYGVYKRQSQVARQEITILPIMMSLTTNQVGDVQVNNDSPYEIDISNYRLIGDKTFTFPARSIMLPNQTITIHQFLVGETNNKMLALYDTESELVTSKLPQTSLNLETPRDLGTITMSNQSPAVPKISAISDARMTSLSTGQFTFVNDKTITPALATVSEEVTIPDTLSNPQLAAAAGVPPVKSLPWPELALVGVVAVGVLGILARPARNEKS